MASSKTVVSSSTQIGYKIQKAKEAFPLWKTASFHQRRMYLSRLKNIIYKERTNIIELMVNDSGRIRFSAEGLVFEILNTFGITQEAEKILTEKNRIRLSGVSYRTKNCRVIYEPYGVVGIVAPSNSPFFESFQQIIQALVMGNTVVVKPPETSPQLSHMIEDLVEKSDLPEGVINVIHGGSEEGSMLVKSEDIDKIVCFGTYATGQKITAASANAIKPMFLGLEGAEAAIVLDDCHIQRTIQGLVYGAFCHSGQNCSCIRKIIIQKKIAKQMISGLVDRTKSLKLTSAEAVDNEIGAIKKKSDVQALLEAVKDAQARGAHLLAGGDFEEERGSITPIILANITEQMPIFQKAFTGPYVCILEAATEDEALRVANNTAYGLSGSIWTSDLKKGEALAQKMQAGTVWINDSQFYHYKVPYGGIKHSGYGKTSGREGLLNFVRPKIICIETSAKIPFYWFPYTKMKLKILSIMLSIKHDPNITQRLKSFIKLFTLKKP